MKNSDIYFCVSSGNRTLIDEGCGMFLVAAIGSREIRGMGATEISDHSPPQAPASREYRIDTIGSDPDTFTDLIQEMCNYSSIQTSYIDTNVCPIINDKHVKHGILAFLVLSRNFIYNLDISTQISKCRLCF